MVVGPEGDGSARDFIAEQDQLIARKSGLPALAIKNMRWSAKKAKTNLPKAYSMSLRFPNENRFYDATRRAVRFWGHDSAMEAVFFVTEDALRRLQPNVRLDEPSLLSAFDANRDLIHAAAANVYAPGRKGSYDVNSTDF
jgi:hypothetical protein